MLCFFRAEQTYEYTPPEALLNATWYQGPTSSTLKYVMSYMKSAFVFIFFLFKMLLDLLVLQFLKQSFCFHRYDMWSVGVVMLELVLGTPNVFQINALTRALLDRQLEGWNEGVKELAYK